MRYRNGGGDDAAGPYGWDTAADNETSGGGKTLTPQTLGEDDGPLDTEEL